VTLFSIPPDTLRQRGAAKGYTDGTMLDRHQWCAVLGFSPAYGTLGVVVNAYGLGPRGVVSVSPPATHVGRRWCRSFADLLEMQRIYHDGYKRDAASRQAVRPVIGFRK
jgi:hypothetical protein